MHYGCASHGRGDSQPDLAGGHVCAEARNGGEPVVERRARIPETVRGACQAAVARLDRPTRTIIPTHRGTIESRLWPFAAHLVQAPAPAMAFVIPFLNVTAGVVVGASFALVMDNASVGEERTVELVQCGQLAKSQIVNQDGGSVHRILRAAAEINHSSLR